ncbi:MAG: hypothetical protein M0Q24_03770 [Sulfurimonas sp.]|uniref:hypothetical protein n=1 Tax=Sulfurimonas sp. TaxID=2022749 RepID=UPI0025D7D87B|nr:hypothetical protein [Sulfurimonas sp.]MCK9491187.1 hypothetical protein [Sulfurimonas sp.]
MKFKIITLILSFITILLMNGCSGQGNSINIASFPKLFVPTSMLKEDSITVNTKNKYRVDGLGMLGSTVALCYIYDNEINEENSFKLRYKFEDMGYGFTSWMEGKYWDIASQDYLLYTGKSVGNKKVLCKREPNGFASAFKDFETGFLTPEIIDEKVNSNM